MAEEKLEKYTKVLSVPIFTLALVTLAVINLSKIDINWWIFFLIDFPFFFVSIYIFRRCLSWVLSEIHNADSSTYSVKVIDISLRDSNIANPYFRIFYDTRGKILAIYNVSFYEIRPPEIGYLRQFYDICDLNEQKLLTLISDYISDGKIK